MARFKFKLVGVLRQRRQVERQRQRELAVIQGEKVRLENELRGITGQVQEAEQEMRARLVGRLDLNYLAAHRRYVLTMEKRGMAMVQKLAQLQRQVEGAQKLLAA